MTGWDKENKKNKESLVGTLSWMMQFEEMNY
jgi:hypothetical protein